MLNSKKLDGNVTLILLSLSRALQSGKEVTGTSSTGELLKEPNNGV